MREGKCLRNGWSRSSSRRLWFVWVAVLVLGGTCGGPAYSQEITASPSWRGPLEILRQNSNEIVELSLTQEQLVSGLRSEIGSLQQLSSEQRTDNEQLTRLLGEQQIDYRTLETEHDRSQRSHDATSKYWTSYLEQSETEIQRAWTVARRNGLVWKIGIPVGVLAGALAWEVIR